MTREPFEFKQIEPAGAEKPPFSVVVVNDPDPVSLGVEWRALEARANGSFFTSWAWVAAALATGLTRPLVVRVTTATSVVALGIFNRRSAWFSRRLSLTSVGDPVLDTAYIEHNGPLVDRDYPQAAAVWWRAVAHLDAAIVDLPGIAAAALTDLGGIGALSIERRQPAPRRSLGPVRACGGDVTTLMSANSRAQLRRAIRSYQRSGPITMARAETHREAERVFEQMAELHQRAWRRRGQAGAMSAVFRNFHQHILATGVAAGTVDLWTVQAGDRLIGYLYNFRHGDQVAAYQSGFAYDAAQPHEKPGLVCHAMAISHYAQAGFADYDFLAGPARYKSSFADHDAELVWVRLAMGYAPMAVMAKGRMMLRAVRAGLGAGSGKFCRKILQLRNRRREKSS
jgi:CelD/BcsL family acetyltransferase involved in cellulose biosynthesis